MKNQITQGEVHAKDGQIYTIQDGKTFALIPYYDKGNEEQEANAELIAEAFNVTNECGYTPIELLAQNNDLKHSLEKAREILLKQLLAQQNNHQ